MPGPAVPSEARGHRPVFSCPVAAWRQRGGALGSAAVQTCGRSAVSAGRETAPSRAINFSVCVQLCGRLRLTGWAAGPSAAELKDACGFVISSQAGLAQLGPPREWVAVQGGAGTKGSPAPGTRRTGCYLLCLFSEGETAHVAVSLCFPLRCRPASPNFRPPGFPDLVKGEGLSHCHHASTPIQWPGWGQTPGCVSSSSCLSCSSCHVQAAVPVSRSEGMASGTGSSSFTQKQVWVLA